MKAKDTIFGLLLLKISVYIHIYIPSFRLVGGFLVAQLVRIDLEPSHCPFMRAIAFSASTFFVNETNPYPFDFRVWGSRTTRQSLQYEIMRSNKNHNLIKCYSFVVAYIVWSLTFNSKQITKSAEQIWNSQTKSLHRFKKMYYIRFPDFILINPFVQYIISLSHLCIS